MSRRKTLRPPKEDEAQWPQLEDNRKTLRNSCTAEVEKMMDDCSVTVLSGQQNNDLFGRIALF
jgi:hypothetical protein